MDEFNVEVSETDIKNAKKFRMVLILSSVGAVLLLGTVIFFRVMNIINPKPEVAPDIINKAAITRKVEIKTVSDNDDIDGALQSVNYVSAPTNLDIDADIDINADYNYDFSVNTANNSFSVADANVDNANDNKIVDIYGTNKGSVRSGTQLVSLCSEKPVIYVYNIDGERLRFSLEFPGQLSSTYPVINGNSWDLTVYSNSMFQDAKGTYYPYLFYEGFMEQNMFTEIKEGACVKGEDTVEFLYDTLKQFGMSDIECSDFITYWAPRMIKNPYNLISFQNSRYSALVPIKTDPVIDTQIRIYMVWQASDVEVELIPQTLEVLDRPEDGTIPYLLEWGGAELGSSGVYGVSGKQISEMSADEIQQEILSLSDMTTKANQRLSNLMAASSGIEAVNTGSSTGGHTFKDKNGRTAVFTTSEWQKLHDTWDYTGKFDEMIQQFTVEELKNYLNSFK